VLGGHERPQHPGEFLHPLVLYFVEALTQVVKNCAVADLSLTIALWIVESGESVDDFILGAEVYHLPAHEVGPIVGDDLEKSEVTYNFCQRNFTICYHETSEKGTAFTYFVK